MKVYVRDKFKDVKEGQMIGNWKIVSNHLFQKGNNLYTKCLCTNCNIVKDIRPYDLLSGKSKNCSKCFKGSNYKGILSTVFNKIKSDAKDRNIEFNITIEDIGDLFETQKGKCALSGISLKLKKFYNDKTSTASLDRIRNNEGYVKGNIQWVYRPINFMKGTLEEGEFIFLCKKIIFNNKNNK